MDNSTEPVLLTKRRPLMRDKDGNPLFIAMPAKLAAMESAAGDLFQVLGHVSVTQLKSLRPTGEFVNLISALITVRQIMGGEGSV